MSSVLIVKIHRSNFWIQVIRPVRPSVSPSFRGKCFNAGYYVQTFQPFFFILATAFDEPPDIHGTTVPDEPPDIHGTTVPDEPPDIHGTTVPDEAPDIHGTTVPDEHPDIHGTTVPDEPTNTHRTTVPDEPPDIHRTTGPRLMNPQTYTLPQSLV